ncbi:MAG: type IV pili twitching motility protein PilT [Nitrospirae bacterium CG_4_9_14_3_um_filter_53_35]|nr:MAG: type IV pili twitching motility protein PilT [Nitrospirae bacterium CG2_30_53_67]PIS37028.1 MAG: type IV pili twitching motility protein PilT [Nitrospirae bacterium CG08_land_8_20_14_0_20_52_24]PIV85300.1 MAG: type IV pili twitching motility protein PilT [Nitrospirae bacterium CG17_big_fil_post_rev_8_21_14_2_50_50_9]PIW84958.1 MAG: type IV pili twitching motility protein PilT [Nitrospirae bacterium CG_4_8_14_3_um_filter_50_41]PIX84744.1 MAG: type IV pili twitching motility protein PilT 
MDLNGLLKTAIERKASDVHFKVGSPPVLRIDGELIPMIEHKRLISEDTIGIAFSIMNNYQKQKFKTNNETDVAYSVPGLGRFRVNIFQQRSTVAIVLRVIPHRIQQIADLNLPPVLEKLSLMQRGLVLVTGTTGSGKTTTLAAMIDHINNNRTSNVITIEDPIEFLHKDKKSIINQREIGTDVKAFDGALRSALRQDPDVILVGEMRDYDTISTALMAAETGHFVMSTLHTVDAMETVNRIIAVFPPHQQKQIRIQLSAVIKGIISQRLVVRADGKGRIPAVEVMLATDLIREYIVDKDKTRLIHDAIAAGRSQYGMQTFDQSLMEIYHRGLISYDEALKRSSNPEDFALKARGIQSTSDLSWEEQEKASGKGGTASNQEEEFKIDRFFT